MKNLLFLFLVLAVSGCSFALKEDCRIRAYGIEEEEVEELLEKISDKSQAASLKSEAPEPQENKITVYK